MLNQYYSEGNVSATLADITEGEYRVMQAGLGSCQEPTPVYISVVHELRLYTFHQSALILLQLLWQYQVLRPLHHKVGNCVVHKW